VPIRSVQPKITKIWEQNKNLGNKITKIWEQKSRKQNLHKFKKKFKKYGNKNLGTKISKIREQKLQKSEN
jgi:hypothetical protein